MFEYLEINRLWKADSNQGPSLPLSLPGPDGGLHKQRHLLWPLTLPIADVLPRQGHKEKTRHPVCILPKLSCLSVLGQAALRKDKHCVHTQSFWGLSTSLSCSVSPSPYFLADYSLFSCPPPCFFSLNNWMGAPGRQSHRVVFVKGEKGSSDPGGSG